MKYPEVTLFVFTQCNCRAAFPEKICHPTAFADFGKMARQYVDLELIGRDQAGELFDGFLFRLD